MEGGRGLSLLRIFILRARRFLPRVFLFYKHAAEAVFVLFLLRESNFIFSDFALLARSVWESPSIERFLFEFLARAHFCIKRHKSKHSLRKKSEA